MTAPTASPTATLSLAFGTRFEDLYDTDGLARLDGRFLAYLEAADPGLKARLLAGRAAPGSLATKEEAELLLAVSPVLDDFVAELFGIVPEVDRLVAAHTETEPLFRVKRKFVQRRAMLKIKADEAAKLDGPALEAELAARLGGRFEELALSRAVLEWQADEVANAEALSLADRYCA